MLRKGVPLTEESNQAKKANKGFELEQNHEIIKEEY